MTSKQGNIIYCLLSRLGKAERCLLVDPRDRRSDSNRMDDREADTKWLLIIETVCQFAWHVIQLALRTELSGLPEPSTLTIHDKQ